MYYLKHYRNINKWCFLCPCLKGHYLGSKSQVVDFMIKSDFNKQEIDYALATMDDRLDNVAEFGINKTFIFSKDDILTDERFEYVA